jgi:sugar lactone lactonase YvrE
MNHPTAPLALALLSLVAPAACSDDDPPGPAGTVIELSNPAFYPEGVAFDADGSMFVSSIATGQVVRVRSGQRADEELVAAGTAASSAVGLTMARRGDLLWMCVGTFGSAAPPAIVGLDPDRGQEMVRHPFPAQRDGRTGGLCNELTEDDAGNLYVSDSFGARVLRLAAADRTTAGPLTVWAEAPELGAQGFGINGLAFDGDSALLAVNTSAGTLSRLPIGRDGAAGALEPIALARPLRAPDGLRIRDGRAIIVEQGAGELTSLELKSGTLTTLATGLREPTSLDLWGDHAWVSEGQLSHLINQTAAELPFTVVRVAL